MGSSAISLPAGYTLDQTQNQGQQQPSGVQLPKGYKLDVPNPTSGFLTNPGQKPPAQPKADLPNDLPEKAADLGLSALPYAGAIGAGIATGGAGFIPGVLAAAGGGGLGGAIEQAGRYITGINPPSSVGDAAKKAGVDALEQGGMEAGGRALGAVVGRTLGKYLDSDRLYQSALKPRGTDQAAAQRTVDAGINEGIRLNEAAGPEVKSRIADLNNQIKGVIQSTPADIPPAQYTANVQARLDALRSKWGNVAGEGQQYLDQIDNFEKNFLLQSGNPRAAMVNGKMVMPEDMDLPMLRAHVQPISADNAQAIKQATYEAIRTKSQNAYAPNVHPGLQVRMQKDLAGAMREELENLYPELGPLNQRQGGLIELDRAIGSFVKREANKQVTPYFVWPAAAAAFGTGAATGHAEGGMLGAASILGGHLTRQMLEDPAVKSALAIALHRVSKTGAAKIAGKVVTGPNVARAAGYGLQRADPLGLQQHIQP